MQVDQRCQGKLRRKAASMHFVSETCCPEAIVGMILLKPFRKVNVLHLNKMTSSNIKEND